MSEYSVEITESALAAIKAQTRYIAVDRQEPANAQRWLQQVWDAVDSLERWPVRAAKAEEDNYVAYEVRQLLVGSHLLLFSLDDDLHIVTIVGLRHVRRRLP